jgi:hypothetical protein
MPVYPSRAMRGKLFSISSGSATCADAMLDHKLTERATLRGGRKLDWSLHVKLVESLGIVPGCGGMGV